MAGPCTSSGADWSSVSEELAWAGVEAGRLLQAVWARGLRDSCPLCPLWAVRSQVVSLMGVHATGWAHDMPHTP